MSDQVAVIGSFVLIAACVALVAFVTKTYRESMALAAAVITSEPGAPIELVCGTRLGLLNATWPGVAVDSMTEVLPSAAWESPGRRVGLMSKQRS